MASLVGLVQMGSLLGLTLGASLEREGIIISEVFTGVLVKGSSD